MNMKTSRAPFRGWIADLSNGQTIFETPPVLNERTAWQKLIDKLKAEDLRITGLQLQRGGKTVHTLPPKACDGYYQAYDYRKMILRNIEERRQGVGSVINGKVFITWLDENGNVWQDVRLMETERLHTTLRD